MSRVANNPVSLPKGVEVKVDAGKIAVKGGKGAKLAEVGSEDIFGISSWTPEQLRSGE